MPNRGRTIHRTATGLAVAEHDGTPVHLHIPVYTVAELRRAYPAGQVHCGSCGETLDYQRLFEMAEERWGPDKVMTFALTHDYYPEHRSAQDPPPAGASQTLGQCPVLYSDRIREEYVRTGDGREEWLYGIVYRDARSPERLYREVWHPTAVFRLPEEVRDAQA